MSPADRPDRSDSPNRRDQAADAAGRASAGGLLREARLAAGLDAVRLASDLRISAQALEALETGQYHLLPGDPYVRALLSSLARHLHLDPQAVIQTYLNEMGVAPISTGQVAPYQDKGEKHSSAHRQIFAVLLVVLIIGLVVVWKQLNSPTILPADPMPGATSDNLVDSLAADTVPESPALRPDSGDTVELRTVGAVDSVRASMDTIKRVPVSPSVPGTPKSAELKQDTVGAAQIPIDSSKPKPASTVLPKDPTPQKIGAGAHLAILQSLGDSLWVKVMRDNKPDDVRLLHRGKSMHIAHDDTVRIALSRRGVLEMTLDGKVMQPTRKRFKILGQYYRPY